VACQTARLGKRARAELQLHALRDLIYSVLFSTLPWLAWQGWWAAVLALLLLTEVVLTLWDFVVEDWVRKPLGGVYPGERIMHGVMGITYGAMLACLGPSLRKLVVYAYRVTDVAGAGSIWVALDHASTRRRSSPFGGTISAPRLNCLAVRGPGFGIESELVFCVAAVIAHDFYRTPKPRRPVFRHIDGNWYAWADW
jgi:hypothetical protein